MKVTRQSGWVRPAYNLEMADGALYQVIQYALKPGMGNIPDWLLENPRYVPLIWHLISPDGTHVESFRTFKSAKGYLIQDQQNGDNKS